MKKLILAAAIAVVLLATQAFAGAFGNMMLGIKGGLNINGFYGDSDLDKETRLDFCAGGFVEIPISQMISFQPELLYTRKGAKVAEKDWSSMDTWKLQYIEIPMLFKAYLPVAPAVKPNLYLGPEVAFRVAGTWEWEEDGETIKEDVEDVADTDVGLIFGAGIGIPAMGHVVSLEARYDLGLSTLDEVEHEPWDIKNSVISVLVGIAF